MIDLCLEKKVDVVVIDNLSNIDLSNLQADEILGSDYQLEKSFLKNNQGIFVFRKLDHVQ